MLAANEAVAAHLEEHLARVHLTASTRSRTRKRVLEFEEIAAQLRLLARRRRHARQALSRSSTRTATAARSARDIVRADEGFRVTSRMYQKLVAKIEGKPEERILSYLMLRSLKQARYSRRERRPLRARRQNLHALHLAHPPLPGPDRPPPARRHARRQAPG